MFVGHGWLIDRPVIERWVPHWVTHVHLLVGLDKVENLGIVANLQVKIKMCTCLSVFFHNRFRINSDWNTFNLESHSFQRTLEAITRLNKIDAINTVNDDVSLVKIDICSLILQQGRLDEHWYSL